MSKQHRTPFYKLDEARHRAGFFVREACTELGIKERTWYRWQAAGQGPKWALKALEILSGRLDYFGWKGWYIERGILYSDKLSAKYYNWEESDLLVWAFWRCNSDLKPHRREAQRAGVLATTAGGSGEAPTRRLRGARAPAFHLPGSVAADGGG
jgi:hypothetical protein